MLAAEWAQQSWFGFAISKAEDKVWWSGGGNGYLHTFDLKGTNLTRTSKKELNPIDLKPEDVAKLTEQMRANKVFKSGLCLDEPRGRLYTLDINGGTITAIDLKKPDAEKPPVGTLGGRPYDVSLGRGGHLLYVSDWSGRQVLVVDPTELRVVAKIPVGEHPNQIAVHPKDDRLFVACASSNSVHVIDTKKGVVTEVIYTALFPKAPEGTTPDAVTVSPDGKTLYVANADNNCVAVVDIEKPGESTVTGFIPTGWYPTAVAGTPDSKTILVGVGKGNQTKANPLYTKEELEKKEKDEVKQLARRLLPYPYIGTTLSGSLSIVPVPDENSRNGPRRSTRTARIPTRYSPPLHTPRRRRFPHAWATPAPSSTSSTSSRRTAPTIRSSATSPPARIPRATATRACACFRER